MDMKENLIKETVTLLLGKYYSFAKVIASTPIEYRTNLKYHTAATDGEKIYLDPIYFANLSLDNRIFLLAHEVLHIKFFHPFRLVDKNGIKRHLPTWNFVVDIIVNNFLEKDGLTIPEGFAKVPLDLNYNAEELYDLLISQEEIQNSISDMICQDDHSLWEEAFEKQNKKREIITVDEAEWFNRAKKDDLKLIQENFKNMQEDLKKHLKDDKNREDISIGFVGEGKQCLDWKFLLRREIAKTEAIWSRRRSVLENNYAYRLEENEQKEEIETEVMIDISGSVEIELIKAFLRMIKPILEESRLKVGCFNEVFWGMTEIKTFKDIDHFCIPKESRGKTARTENWDLAVRSFSKKIGINKIVFTDGKPQPGVMPLKDLKNENVIWLVYGNKEFKPCCGKVITIEEEQLQQLHQEKEKIKVKRY